MRHVVRSVARDLGLTALAALSFGLVVGCKGDADRAAPSATAVNETAPATTGVTKASGKPALPAGRTPVPTLEEWSSIRKEVTVKGSSALSCETKIVREYLRVSCKGKNDSGGTPTTVKVIKGGRGEAFTFASGGVTSLIVPFVSGIDMEAEFSWTDKSHKLAVKWPRGAPTPPIVGVFEGAKSPLDGTAGASAEKLCDCHKKVMKAATCDDLFGGPNPDCERTYGNDCQRLLECSRGEPSSMPTCLPGWINAGIGYCYKTCGAGNTCPAGMVCDKDMMATPICIEQ